MENIFELMKLHVVEPWEATLADLRPSRVASHHGVEMQERTLAETQPSRLAVERALAQTYQADGL